ncbi:glycosyltransferase family 39 protein [Streptodolium elevatio]
MSSDQTKRTGPDPETRPEAPASTAAPTAPATPTSATARYPDLPAFAVKPVAVVAVVFAAVQAAFSGRYGFHRDELYFMAAGDHLAWGYVDQPPLTPLLARASTELFGDSPTGLRAVALLAAVAAVFVVALTARELGGTPRVQVLAALCATVSAYVLASGHMVSTSTFDLLCWLVITWIALRLLRTGDGRWWPAMGVAVGIGLFNKHLVAMLAGALLVAVLAVGPRRVLRNWWPLVGAAIVVALALPNVLWQIDHDWPTLDVAEGIREEDGGENRAMFVPQQIIMLSPFLVPVWAAGLVALFRDPALRWARAVAVAYPLVCLAVLATGGKSYYALPLLLVMTAAGCAPVVRWMRDGWRTRRARLVIAGLAVSAVVNAVVTLPVLPADSLDVPNAMNKEQGEQVGWPELADAVALGWRQVPADQQARAVVFAGNYGEAGALVRYGPERGLPEPYSGHMAFADWGPPPDSANGPVLLVRIDGAEGQDRFFTGCRLVGRVDNGKDVDNEEQDAQVQLCTGTTAPWSVMWPDMRRGY